LLPFCSCSLDAYCPAPLPLNWQRVCTSSDPTTFVGFSASVCFFRHHSYPLRCYYCFAAAISCLPGSSILVLRKSRVLASSWADHYHY
jgi:hypothetical protein